MACALGAGLGTFTITAGAQSQAQGFAIDRYRPTPTGDRFFAVAGADTTGWLVPRAELGVDYAMSPLVLETRCVAPTEGCDPNAASENKVVSDQVYLHASGSMALFDRVLVSVDVPIAVVNQGDSPNTAAGGSIISPDSAAMGDVRAGLRVRLVGESRDPIALAIGGYVWFPSGDAEAYTGNDSVRGMPQVSASGLYEASPDVSVIWGTELGVMVRDQSMPFGNVALGPELTFGGGAGVLLVDETLQLGPEFYGSTVVASEGDTFASNTTHLEILGGARYRFLEDFRAGVAVGPGLTDGVGTPTLRAAAHLGYAPLGRQSDRDDDGIYDVDDACPTIPGEPHEDPKKHGCPPDRDDDGIYDVDDACPTVAGEPHPDPKRHGCPPDRDDDTIVDVEDACPDTPGVRHPDKRKNGCPPDKDDDGIADLDDACPTIAGVAHPDPRRHGCPSDKDDDSIIDLEDACPLEPGVRHPDPKLNGCPPDTDGDSIPDNKDACPLESGPANADPKLHGCPTLVRVTGDKIEILQQPRFEFDKSEILPESADLLSQVAQVLREHPEITKVLIEGHTDDRGPANYNKRLSDKRAQAVKEWLIRIGIDADRLDHEGFGEEKPIAPNDNDQGRAKNRRVEFRIVTKDASKQKGAAPKPEGNGAGEKSEAPKQ